LFVVGIHKFALTRWHNKGAESEFKSFNTIVATVYEYYGEILNFFVICSTNASVESFNAKIKNFRASLRGVNDMDFFLFRVSMIFAKHRGLLMTRKALQNQLPEIEIITASHYYKLVINSLH
jgi:hypothetical protein